METIKKQKLKVLDEDGFLALIGSRGCVSCWLFFA